MDGYPVRYSVDYQEGGHSRGLAFAGVFFFVKAIALIPHMIALFFVGIAAFFVLVGSLFVIVFTGAIPEWGVRWSVGVTNWSLRVNTWLFGMRDEYPPFGLDATYPGSIQTNLGGPERSRGLALTTILYPVRMLLALPHLLVLSVLSWLASIVAYVGFWIVLFTGRLPEGIHAFMNGVLSWSARAGLWIVSVVDEYPPFEWDDGSGSQTV